jgi:membrane protein CcdC involved in cytochrome C biogenesis
LGAVLFWGDFVFLLILTPIFKIIEDSLNVGLLSGLLFLFAVRILGVIFAILGMVRLWKYFKEQKNSNINYVKP